MKSQFVCITMHIGQCNIIDGFDNLQQHVSNTNNCDCFNATLRNESSLATHKHIVLVHMKQLTFNVWRKWYHWVNGSCLDVV